MSEFRMPALGADMEKGTLVQWFVKPGSHVKRGDIVADVETDKGTIAVEIWETGDVDEIFVAPGQEVPVGTVLASVRSEAKESAKEPIKEPTKQSAKESVPSLATSGKRVHASPLARRLAESLGVMLADIKGSGAGGAITRADVESAAKARTEAAKTPARTTPAPSESTQAANVAERMRHAIDVAMTKSKREIPHYYLQTDINMRTAMSWLKETNRQRQVTERLLPIVLVLRAITMALKEYPEFNGHFSDGTFHPASAVNLAVAVSMRTGGLVAPAIIDAQSLSLSELMAKLQDLIQRSRRGKLRSSEISSASITVTSLGEQGAEQVFGVIYPPQVALIGLGRIRDKPWAEQGLLGVAPILTITLSADHRVSDGHRGSRFLAAIDQLLQQPDLLAKEEQVKR
jgi:pyruvate dehydrogenase E2 component (dihydrolipoamide acetyltransferase)